MIDYLFVCSFTPIVEAHEYAMGDFSIILSNDIVINNIWTHICESTSWEDRCSYFLCCVALTKHGRTWLMVMRSGPIVDFAFLSFGPKKKECWNYTNYWKSKSVNLKVATTKMTVMEKFHSKHREFELKVSAQTMCITSVFWIELE